MEDSQNWQEKKMDGMDQIGLANVPAWLQYNPICIDFSNEQAKRPFAVLCHLNEQQNWQINWVVQVQHITVGNTI